ncbi:acid protease [Wolfiporia cocos MD-104 SS10]|uniref:Acid protease n=1 Tax=Wolfiporia cocos (strain MD-104) TaxID=742152 RepID=A0A2H3JBX0_WOLCO|nr:acid protease [Wolfiporia cocos MD-104 SS10]
MSVKSSLVPGFAKFFDPSAPATNAALKAVTSVGAGDYQIFNNVLVDTGSAILWVGAQERYDAGPYTRKINQTFSVGYGTGGVNGTAYLDRVTIGEATVSSQIIGNQSYLTGFSLVEPIDGIFGLGPSGSNGGEVSGYNTTPTFVENLVSEGSIDEPVFGIYVSALSQDGIPEGLGEITFGGVDDSRIQGEINWIPQNEPYNFHWEFNASSLVWGGEVVVDGSIYARTDTGVLGIAIPFDAFFTIFDSVPGATIDETSALTGYLVFPSNLTAENLPSLGVGIGNLTFDIPASDYIVPTALYSALNISDDQTHTWIASGGPDMYDLGQKFLEHAYSAYDMDRHLVGFAHLA